MKKSIKQACQLLLTLSLVLIMVDGGFIGNIYALHHDRCQPECIDFPDHFEHSHPHNADDLTSTGSSKIPIGVLPTNVEAFPTMSHVISDNYISCIWQPPKFS